MACKVDSAFLKRTLENPAENGEEMLNQGKLKYAMLKDELSMCTTKKFYGTSGHAAYPLVVTTVGDLDDDTKNFLKQIYGCPTATDFLHCTSKETKDATAKDAASNSKFKTVTNALPEFRCQGVALGQAFASHLSGDTVATVLVGGMATVMNGAFEIFAGDEVQWYFGFEQDAFYQESNTDYRQGQRRTTQDPNERMPLHVSKKMRYNDARLMGSQPGLGNTKGFKNPESVFRIKSYQPYIIDIGGTKIATTHYGDKIRVFAKAMSSARPFDQVDIMICTQAS
jgi:hypothetical protein